MKQLILSPLYVILILTSISSFCQSQSINLEEIASGLNSPVDIKNAGDNRLFIVEQGGLIKIVNESSEVLSIPFLDLSTLTSSGNEQGLLSVAFPNDYTTTGKFYVYYTNTSGDSVIAEYNVSTTNPNMADPNGTTILTFSQPFANHNAGCLQFSTDNLLYIASGDGGSGGDPGNRAQDNTTLLGKMLRIDVSTPSNGLPYSIPSGNPFSNGAGADEIFSTGLRNPWKFSFDSAENRIWIADVGQNQTEEINSQLISNNTANYGWRCYEGSNSFNQSGNCPDDSELIFPVAEYNHTGDGRNKCSITGGYVYRGLEFPSFSGMYFFADFCSGEIGMLDSDATDPEITYEYFENSRFSSFGIDNQNELYVAERNSGTIYKITSATAGTEDYSSSIRIFPNPANSFINLDDPNSLFNHYTVFDSAGRTLANGVISDQHQINISELASGLFFLQVSGENHVKSASFLVR